MVFSPLSLGAKILGILMGLTSDITSTPPPDYVVSLDFLQLPSFTYIIWSYFDNYGTTVNDQKF